MIIVIVLLVIVEAIQERLGPQFRFAQIPTVARWAIYEILLLCIVFMGANGGPQFIYFQF